MPQDQRWQIARGVRVAGIRVTRIRVARSVNRPYREMSVWTTTMMKLECFAAAWRVPSKQLQTSKTCVGKVLGAQ